MGNLLPGFTRGLLLLLAFASSAGAAPAPANEAWFALDGSAPAPEPRRLSVGGVLPTSEDTPSVALGVDADGRPILAWSETYAGHQTIYLSRHSPDGWEGLARSNEGAGLARALSPSLPSLPNPYPKLAGLFTDRAGKLLVAMKTLDRAHVLRWSGTAWEDLSPPPFPKIRDRLPATSVLCPAAACFNPSGPELALDRAGHPVVTATESDGRVTRAVVLRWTGAKWQKLVGPVIGAWDPCGCDRTTYQFAIDDSGRPAIAWVAQGRIEGAAWRGGAWRELGSLPAPSWGAALAFDDGGPWLALADSSGLKVYRHGATSWELAPGPAVTGTLLRFEGGKRPWIAIQSAAGNVARVTLQEWDGATFRPVPEGSADHSVALGSNAGHPTVARGADSWYLAWGGGRQIQVRAWSQRAWTGVGSDAPAVASLSDERSASAPSLAFSLGQPVVAWAAQDGPQQHSLVVRRYTGERWETLAPPPILEGPVGRPLLAADRKGRLIAAWAVADPSTAIARWDAGAWQVLLAPRPREGRSAVDASQSATALLIGEDDEPIVAWSVRRNGPGEVYVSRWDGGEWRVIHQQTPGVAIGLASDLHRRLLVATLEWEGNAPTQTLRVVRQRDGGDLVAAAPPLGFTREAQPPENLYLSATRGGGLLVAWIDPGSENVRVYHWDGSAWRDLRVPDLHVAPASSSPLTLATDSAGLPILGWSDPVGEVRLRRWSGRAWEEVEGATTGGGVSNSEPDSVSPSVSAGANLLCVAWREQIRSAWAALLRCQRSSPPRGALP